jgi:hypothetical protein
MMSTRSNPLEPSKKLIFRLTFSFRIDHLVQRFPDSYWGVSVALRQGWISCCGCVLAKVYSKPTR